MLFFDLQPERFIDNHLVDVNVLTGKSLKDGRFVGYRTDYSDVEEVVDRKYWQPSTVAVSQVGRHPSNGTSMYDSPALLKSSKVAELNASIRHPSNDIVETSTHLLRLKQVTNEVAMADLKAQADKKQSVDSDSAPTVPHNVSTPPSATIGG